MRVLIACEESQTVCKAFRKLGHEAYSCDIQECSGGHPEWHIQGDVTKILKPTDTGYGLKEGINFTTSDGVFHILDEKWDLIIAHPPCTYLSNAGIAWFNEEKYGDKARKRKEDRLEAFDFFMLFANANCEHIAIENPVGYVNSHWRKPDQTIQPYHFGDPDSKRTCLWLKGLPKLQHTNVVEPKIYAYYKKGPKKGKPIYWCDYKMFGDDRAKIRSKTFQGIADAMADQWGSCVQALLDIKSWTENNDTNNS